MELPPEEEYDFNKECEDAYFIENESGINSMGHLCQCTKCGRKIAIDLPLIGTRHHMDPMVNCGECIDLKAVDKNFPDIARKMKNWLGK